MPGKQTIGTLLVRLLLEDSQYRKGLKESERSTKQFGGVLKKTADFAGKSLAMGFKVATAAVAAFGAATAVVGANFEQQMSKVAAVRGIDKASDDFQKLTDKARELGQTTLFTATQVGEGMEMLARAGLTTDEIMASTEHSLKLAAATGTDMATATSLVASAMRQFSLDASEAQRITDVYAKVTANSLFNIQGLADAMKFAGTVGSALGMSIEETSAAVAQFRDLGLDASLAGTQFRMAMAQAINPTDEAAKALDKYGLTVDDINPKLQGFDGVLRKLGEAGVEVEDTFEIFGRRAGGSMARLSQQFGESSEKFDTLLAGLRDSAGTTGAMYETMTDNVMGKFLEMKSAIEEVLLTVFDSVGGPLADLLSALRDLFRDVGSRLGLLQGDLDDGIGATLQNLADMIRENSDEWAVRISDGIVELGKASSAIATIASALETVLPYLDEIAILLATIWATQQAMTFAAFLTGVLIPAVVAAEFSFAGLATALAGATGGLSVLAAGLAVVAAGLALVAKRAWAAKAAQDALADQQERAAFMTETRTRTLESAMYTLLRSTREHNAEQIKAMKAGEGVTDAFRAEYYALKDLNAVTAAAAWESGKLVKVGENLQTVEYALAEGGAAGMEAVAKRIDQLTTSIARDEKSLSVARAKADMDEVKRLEGLIGLHEDAAESLQVAHDAARGLSDEIDTGGMGGLAEGLTEAADKYQEILDGIVAARAQAADAIAMVGADEDEQERVRLESRLRTTRETYEKQIREAELSADEEARVREELEALLGQIREEHGKRRHQDALDAEQEYLVQEQEERLEREREASERVAAIRTRIVTENMTDLEKLEAEWVEVQKDLAHVSAQERLIVEEWYEGEIAKLRGEESRKSEGFFARMLSQGKQAFEGIAKAAQVAGKAMQGLRDLAEGVLGIFAKITGLTGAMGSLGEIMTTAGTGSPLAGSAGKATGKGGDVSQSLGIGQAVGDLVDGGVEFLAQLIDALPIVVEKVIEKLPELIDALVAQLPVLVQAVVDIIPDVIQFIADQAPVILQAVVDALVMIVEALPGLVDAIVAELPGLIMALVDELPRLIQALLIALPQIIDGILTALPGLITALLDGVIEIVPVLILAVLEAVPKIIVSLIEALPKILQSILEKIPVIITTMIGLLPDVILAFAEMLPDLLPAIIAMVPEILGVVIASIPEIVIALVEALIVELPKELWRLAPAIGRAILDGLLAVWDAIKDLFSGLFKKIFGGKKNKDEQDGSAFSGISFVPATMRMLLHPGEAVIPAHRNPARAVGGAMPALPGVKGAGDGGGPTTIPIAVYLGGVLVDRSVVHANKSGESVGVQNMINRAAGVKVGIDPGNFSYWGK